MSISLDYQIPDSLDEEDALAILSIGEKEISHTKIQKIAYIISSITGIKGDFTSHHYGDFSENIMEKIQSPLNRDIFNVKDDRYSLTVKGNIIYRKLLDEINHAEEVKIESLLSLLRKLNAENLEALTYHLFPETAVNSKIRPEINKEISKLKAKNEIKAIRRGGRIILSLK